MDESGLVSIIIPTYNQAKYIRACLDSIWFQHYDNIEIIIINDGSTDATETVIEEFERELENSKSSFASYYDEDHDMIARCYHNRYPKLGRKINSIKHKTNMGLASALNTGIKNCRGSYCTYVPSDDYCFPSMISDMVQALESSHTDFVYADMFIVDDGGEILRKFSLPDYSFQRCFADWYLCGVAKLYKRSLHEQFGYYNENLLAHDHELFLRFAMQGARFCHIPRVLMAVRDHSREREIDIHSPDNWRRLLEESKALVREAREFMKALKK